jgi:hypothetical protein
LARAFATVLEPAGYVVRFERSFEKLGEASPRPSREELAACVALFAQVDLTGFPRASDLPGACGTVRFPALDTNLLWPFAAINPYDEPRLPDLPGGLYPYGDRILLRAIEKDWEAARVVDYYLTRYDEYRVDLGRVAALEVARLHARDRKADVKMADVLEDVRTEPRCWSNNHPRAVLMQTLATRVASAGARYVPELAAFDTPVGAFENGDGVGAWAAVPIHPGVAADLGLAWFDPTMRYLQVDGSLQTYDEYVRGFVRWSMENRERQRERGTASIHDALKWRPPLDGPARFAGPVLGFYPDMFCAPTLRGELDALADIETVTLEVYYPPQQSRPATVVFTLGAAKTQAVIEPGSACTLIVRDHVSRGQRVRFSLTCSQTLNMFERGESEDNRDLGVLMLAMRAT